MSKLRLTHLTIALGFAVPLCASCAFAAGGQDSVDTIVVTASRLDRPAGELTRSVQVIDRQDIESRQVPNVTELLRQVAGLTVIQQGARGGVTSVVLRGGESNFTVVMIDGVKVNDSTNTRGGSYDFSYLDISAVERVEIIRGPMSAVYGSDALAGVINIITRTGADGSQIGVEVGGHGLAKGTIALGGTIGNLDLMLGAYGGEDDGDIEGSAYEDLGISGSMRASIADDGEIGLNVRHQNADSTSFPEDSGGPEFAVIRDIDVHSVEETHGRAYVTQSIGDSWRTNATLSRYERSENYISPGIAPGVFDGVPPNSADTDFSRDQFVLSASKAVSDSIALAVGAEWQREKGTSIGVLDVGFPLPTDFRLERDTKSAFVEGDIRRGALILQGSLRWDDPDESSSELSGQLGAVYQLDNGAGDIRLNWGQGFKVPSFFALAHPVVGNPDLRPETANSLDLGFRRKSADESSEIELSVYRNEYKDLIDFDPVLFTNVNRSKVVAQGVEFAIRTQINNSLQIQGHLTYSDADIRGSDSTLRGRPRWRAGAVIDWSIDNQWRLVTSLLSLDEFYEVSIPTGGLYLNAYQRLDTALSFSPNERLKLVFAIDNLLDEDYQEAVGFPGAGVRGRLRAIYSF